MIGLQYRRWSALAVAGVVAAGMVLTGCGPDEQTVGDNARLVITPADAVYRVVGNVAVSGDYTATLVDDNGNESDVTAETTFAIDQSILGGFDGATFTTSTHNGGAAELTATYGSAKATGQITVLISENIIGPGADANTPGLFDSAADGGSNPTLVYPATGTMLPPNLNTFEFHYEPGAGNNVFELRFASGFYELRMFFSCTALGTGCRFEPDQATWDTLAALGRGKPPVYYSLHGLDKNQASPVVGHSDTQVMHVSQEDLLGGIYYWQADPGLVKRYEFGRRSQTAENFLSVADTNGTTCVGCHAMSRDGSHIAVGWDVPGPSGVDAFTVADRSRLWTWGGNLLTGANFYAFSPGNDKILMSDGNWIKSYNTADRSGEATVVSSGAMPDWAPNGTDVVFAKPGQSLPMQFGNPGILAGSLVLTSSANWGAQTTLATADGGNNYYPAFTPDGQWVIYNRSAAANNSYDAEDARVWIVSRNGGAPIPLETGSPAPGGDSWPKVAPFQHTYSSGTVMWITFASRRPYGLYGGGTAQLWMVGIDTARAAQGQDPSFAAFWLPFQDPATGNHIAQWVEFVDRQTCDVNTPCRTGEFCEEGVCVPIIQ